MLLKANLPGAASATLAPAASGGLGLTPTKPYLLVGSHIYEVQYGPYKNSRFGRLR